MTRIARWVRVAVHAVESAQRAARLQQAILEALVEAWVPPRERAAVTSWVYSRTKTYVPGGVRFEAGLFDWERRAFATPPFPSSGTLLVGGAGGGREVVALAANGYRIVAFEPVARLASACEEVSRRWDGRVVARHASYADLVRAAAGEGGPLAEVLRGSTIAGVVLGWTSFTHVVDAAERRAVLAATRTLAPHAPVIVSYWAPTWEPPSLSDAARDWVGRISRALGAAAFGDDAAQFRVNTGFFRCFSDGEISEVARAAGYEVAHAEGPESAWAMLIPS